MTAFFRCADSYFVPNDQAASNWSSAQLSGAAVCGLLAHELETHQRGRRDVPARFTVDMFSPVLNEPVETRSRIVRDGKRIRVIDAEAIQRGSVKARATAQFLHISEEPPGEVWQPVYELSVPEQRLEHPGGSMPLFKAGRSPWSPDAANGGGDDRKAIWNNVPPLVADLPVTPFVRCAIVADLTNLVCNWGTAGVGYINSDVTMALSRLPFGAEVGLLARDHITAAGIAVASAVLYDRNGPVGMCAITALSNARRQVDVNAAFADSPAGLPTLDEVP